MPMTILLAAVADPRGRGQPDEAPPRWLLVLVWIIAAGTLVHAIYVLLAWLTIPLLDSASFRQTQTALSAWWLTWDRPFFAYESPVLGSPWSVPFELPIYQGLAALLASTGINFDAAGRLISFAFMVAGFWPLRMLWHDLRLWPLGLPIACALLLGSPEYLFWSRTFLMESCAWCLASLWLALFVRFLTTGQVPAVIAAILVGLLAVLAKATTFPGFVVLGGLLVLPSLWRWLRSGLPARDGSALILASSAMLLPLIGGLAWVWYSDGIKQANPLGRLLTSHALAAWNYGTFDQRFSARLWNSTIVNRVLPDMFGPAWIVAILLLGYCGRPRAPAVLVLTTAFLTPFLVFTNLHIVHDYYQYANEAFLIVALALALETFAARRWGPVLMAGTLVAILISQTYRFETRQMRWLTPDTEYLPVYRISLLARDLIPTDGSLIVFGDDWSSVAPYYARRKALLVPSWTPPALLEDLLRDPQSHLAGTRFSGVIDCTQGGSGYGPDRQLLVDAFLARRTVMAEYSTCRLLAADR